MATEKSWVPNGDSVCDVCNTNESDGWIGEDELFSSGDSEPNPDSNEPHYHCDCELATREVEIDEMGNTTIISETRRSTMTKDVKEAGKKISAANEEKIRGAVASLNTLLGEVFPEGVTEEVLESFRIKFIEASTPNPPKPNKPGGEKAGIAEQPDKPNAKATAGTSTGTGASDETPVVPPAPVTPAPGVAAMPSVPTPCPSCEKSMPPTANFCASCGHSMGHGDTAAKEAADLDIEGDMIPLVERAVGRDGVAKIKIIQPGWGSSGYYGKDMLERDIPKIFPKGTKMFWDHPTLQEERDRPERSLKDLAGKTVSEPAWDSNGPAGPGMYANAQVFEAFKGSVEEMSGDIGVSIRAGGTGKRGTVEGRSGNIIEKMVRGDSIDYVTAPGAGGKILSLFESARQGGNIVLEENKSKEDEVTDNTELIEANRKVVEAKDKEIARLREAVAARDAQDFLTIEAKKYNLPAPALRRLVETVASDPIMSEESDGTVKLDTKKMAVAFKEAAEAEVKYLASIGVKTGKVRGLSESRRLNDDGEGDEGDDEGETVSEASRKKNEESLEESFRMLGLDENVAKQAAAGRK